jgi:hypothetical protein
MSYFDPLIEQQTIVSIKVSPDVFDIAETEGFIDGEVIKHGKTLYVYAELGRKIPYLSYNQSVKTRYQKYIKCLAVCFAETAQERDDGFFLAELPDNEIVRVDVVLYC